MTATTPSLPTIEADKVHFLRKAVDFARRSDKGLPVRIGGHPATWNQGDWASPIDAWAEPKLKECGTAYCIAGHIVSQQPGYKVRAHAEPDEPTELIETINGEPVDEHSTLAAEALGVSSAMDSDFNWIDSRRALLARLFDGNNDLYTVIPLASELAGEPL